MYARLAAMILSVWMLAGLFFCENAVPASSTEVVIVSPSGASFMEELAASEIRRYLYQRTGVLAPIVSYSPRQADASAIVVARKDRPLAAGKGETLLAQQYLLQTTDHGAYKHIWIIGGDGAGTLYGAYRFAEHLGVRFYLHGDLIPDERIEPQLPDLNETGKPLFETRGIQPFHDFPEGPDWWNEEEYKAILSQLPKLRMNFFGLHTYPENRPNAEPTVWIGLERDFTSDGNVWQSYPSSYQNTLRGNWGYTAKKTSDYTFGADLLFEFDAFGPDVMGTSLPSPTTPEASNNVFNRTGRMLREAFCHARRLGVKTCVGTETPLIVPEWLKERLRSLGKDPTNPSVIRELYEGMFRRIMAAYPIDYYWFWTPEGWIWQGVGEEEVAATKMDMQAAIQAAENVDAPFTLATCGWVLGPESDRALFDRILPKTMPMSCINREVGKAPVQPAFAKIKGRPLWAIPWLEDDPALLNAQLWVGRMRADAVDAFRYGCSGLLGIHWRTRILAPNVSALAAAAWEQGDWGQGVYEEEKEKVEGPVDGQHIAWPEREMDGRDDDVLYQTGRENINAWRIAVPEGNYTVTLKFRSESKNRLFSVGIEGKPALPKLDLHQAAGGADKAVDYSFSNVTVWDGWLDIEFSPMVGTPCLAALSVVSTTFARHINCGGPAYGEFQADWPSSPVKPRHLASGDFYLDWSRHMFGEKVAPQIASIFESIDGKFPCPSDWMNGPGGLGPDTRPWKEVEKEYKFLKKLERLQSDVKGRGNRERFDYWLRQFSFMHALARTRCLWGEMNKIIENRVKPETDAKKKKALVQRKVLPMANRTIESFSEAYQILLPSVGNTGELGTICNLEQHVKDLLIARTAKQLSELAGEEIPLGDTLSQVYEGPARLIVPTVRTNITRGEPFHLKAIILDRFAPREAALYWRGMGKGDFQRIPLSLMRRGVYQGAFPPEATTYSHIEYYIKAISSAGKDLMFPAAAPILNQTVVVMPKG